MRNRFFGTMLLALLVVALLAPMASLAAAPWYVQGVTVDVNGSLEPATLSFDRLNCGWKSGVLTCGWIDGKVKTVTTIFGQGWGVSPTRGTYRFYLTDSDLQIVDFDAPAWMRARITEDGQALELDLNSVNDIGKLPVKNGQVVFPMITLTVADRPSY